MKRNLIYLQFLENGLILLNKKILKEYILTSINNHTIIDKDLFIEEISTILETNKINNKIITDDICILVDNTYDKFYLNNIEQLFKELSFNSIKFINVIDIIKPKEEELIVEISTSNIKIISKSISIKSNIYFFKQKSILGIYLKNIIKKHNIETIYIYGNYTCDKKLIEYLEKTSCAKVYIYTHPTIIPIKLLI